MQGNISRVEPAEFPCLVEIWEAAVRQSHHFLTEDDIAYFKPLVRDEFLYMVELVAMRNEEGLIVGFAGVAENKLEMLFVDPLWHARVSVGACLSTRSSTWEPPRLMSTRRMSKRPGFI